MKVIIIAAGKGKRISNEFKEIPKALIPINGESIFEKQKHVFESSNISEFIVITGPKNKFEDKKIKIIQDFENQNHDILGSLMVAKQLLNDDLIISYSDIIFEQKIIQQILETPGDIVIAIDMNWKKAYEGRTQHTVEEAENVLLNNKNQILQIKKNITEKDELVGEFLGIIKMTKKGSKIFLDKIENLQKSNIGNFHNAESLEKGYLTDMIQELIDCSFVVTPAIISGKWCEIDTKQDLERAEKIFK
mgnify:CR=1 FL=1|jgi:L-glutamine-phosphate cytidylyltransferase